MDALEAISKRRSIRQYSGAPIPRADLEKIVNAGRLAASGHNQQPWEFIVITRREMIECLKVAAEWMDKAAAIIAVVMDTASPFWLQDGAAAVENMLIASTALGYGACWIGGDTMAREDEFKAALGVPPQKRLITLIPVGVPAESPTKDKKSLEAVLHWEQY